MIKCEKGRVKIEGTDPEVLAELVNILRGVDTFVSKDHDKCFAEQIINKAVKMSRMSDEEIATEFKSMQKEIASIILNNLLGDRYV